VDVGADDVKISARATLGLAMAGVDVGRAMAKAAEAAGGEGGGHDVSAAAKIPRTRMEEFIARLDEIFPRVGGV